MNIPIDRSAWTPSSQRSDSHYDDGATAYEGIRCRCRGCELSFVLSAAEQKHAYEIAKRFVRWLPSLCPACAARLVTLREQDRAFQQQWNAAREVLAGDRAFVGAWLAVLDDIAGLARGNAMRVHLRRLLQELSRCCSFQNS